MTEQFWIDFAHIILAVLALMFAGWALYQANLKMYARDYVRMVGLWVVGAFAVGIAVLAVLLALL